MMYPEFQYRAPPPSYQASMQEYRLRLLLLDRHNAASPPPTYRSHPATLLRYSTYFFLIVLMYKHGARRKSYQTTKFQILLTFESLYFNFPKVSNNLLKFNTNLVDVNQNTVCTLFSMLKKYSYSCGSFQIVERPLSNVIRSHLLDKC